MLTFLEILGIKEPLNAQEFEPSSNIYKERTFMVMGPLIIEKCMLMMVNMSLRVLVQWKINYHEEVKIHSHSKSPPPFGQGVLKGRKMLGILNNLDG